MRRIFVFMLALGLVAGVAMADELTTGTIEGTVMSESGEGIADAVVTAIGPQGIRTATTNSKGNFVLRGLPSGTYQVKADAPGYGTVVQNDVAISINRRTQLPFTLTAGVTEEVTVVSQAPLVDMKSTTTGASINIDDFAPYVPLGRNLTSVFSIAPGVSDGGSPVLGSTNASISGSSGLENAYFVDGVNITNSGYGAIGAYSIVYGSLGSGVTYDFLEEVQVKTGGFEAEFGQAGGGIINTVVKTGSNDFGFDVSWYEEPVSLEGSRGDRVDTPNTANQVDSTRQDISITAGGPILKDKLFYFAAYNPVTIEQNFKLTSGDSTVGYDLVGDGTADEFFDVGETIQGGRTPGEVLRERTIDNYAGKVSWFATPNHKIEAIAFGDPSEGEVGPQAPTQFLRNLTDPINIPDATTGATGLDWGGDQYSLKYQGVWSSNFFTELQYSHKENTFSEIGPGVNFRSFFDVDANATFGGAGFYEALSDDVDMYSFKNTHVFGPVEVSYGYQNETILWAQPRLRSGDNYSSWFPNMVEDGAGIPMLVAGCTDPSFQPDGTPTQAACYTRLRSSTGATVDILDSGDAMTPNTYNVTRTVFTEVGQPTDAEESNAYIQANWDVTPRVTLKAGFRWTELELAGSGNETLPIGTLPTSNLAVGGIATSLTAQTYKFDSEIAPRIGVTWDVAGNGKHKLFANWGQYYQRTPSDLAVRAFSNEVGTTSDLFNDADLIVPNLNGMCNLAAGGTAPCHIVNDVQGLAGGGSIILDGTQHEVGSPVYDALHGLHTLTGSEKTAMPYTEEYLAGYAWEMNDYTGVEVRYIHREIGQALEDVQFASNEQTWNLFYGAAGGAANTFGMDVFDGHGSGAFGAYVFANVGGNVNTTLLPIPVRDYDAYEFVFNRRFHGGWMASMNYRFASLEGNYEGSFRNDNGQSDPFLTSLFDFPAASAVDSDLMADANGDGDLTNDFDTFLVSDTLIGQYEPGPLNTERAHIINGFVSKQFDSGLNIGGRLNFQTGQPRGPLFAHPTYRNSGEIPGFNPQYWYRATVIGSDTGAAGVGFLVNERSDLTAIDAMGITDQDFDGDGIADQITGLVNTDARLYSYDVVKRDYFGRTPSIFTIDLHASYDVNLRSKKSKLTFLLDIFNVTNDNDALAFDNAVETRPGSDNPDFLKANQFQPPRNVRIGAKFSW